MKKRKFLGLLLVLCMALALAACGKKEGDSAGKDTKPAASSQEEKGDQEKTDAKKTDSGKTDQGKSGEAKTEGEAQPEGNAESAGEAESQQSDAAAPGSPYVGSYHEQNAGRGMMNISYDGSMYYVEVFWSASASEMMEWTFSGYFDEQGVMEYSNALKVGTVLDESGDGNPTEVYNGGLGSLQWTESGIIWNDEEEHAADGTMFVRD